MFDFDQTGSQAVVHHCMGGMRKWAPTDTIDTTTQLLILIPQQRSRGIIATKINNDQTHVVTYFYTSYNLFSYRHGHLLGYKLVKNSSLVIAEPLLYSQHKFKNNRQLHMAEDESEILSKCSYNK